MKIQMQDPLGELLGAPAGIFAYTFEDAIRLSGHACPTVAGAFLMVKRALELLYGSEIPVRGDIAITVHGGVEEGVNGPISQVFTLVTGAAAGNGFNGLMGQYQRKGLLRFEPAPGVMGPARFTFQRLSNGRKVTLTYNPSGFPPAPSMGEDLQTALGDPSAQQARARFTKAWSDRVQAILADGGANTVREA